MPELSTRFVRASGPGPWEPVGLPWALVEPSPGPWRAPSLGLWRGPSFGHWYWWGTPLSSPLSPRGSSPLGPGGAPGPWRGRSLGPLGPSPEL